MTPQRNPFREIERMFEEMSRQFEESTSRWQEMPSFGGEEMRIDVAEHDDEYVVTADLPGFDKGDIDVEISDQTLVITAEQEEAGEEETETYLKQERTHRSASRSVRLPGAVDAEDVTARYKNGVLTVTLPKAEAGEGRQIDIE